MLLSLFWLRRNRGLREDMALIALPRQLSGNFRANFLPNRLCVLTALRQFLNMAGECKTVSLQPCKCEGVCAHRFVYDWFRDLQAVYAICEQHYAGL
jgi:hypothetical protein